MDQPPYRDVYHALASAYALENRVILRISSALRDLRSEGLSRPYSHLTPWDQHAQAVLVLACVKLYCHQPDIVECRYRRINSPIDLAKKVRACLAMAQRSTYGYNIATLICTAQWGGVALPPAWMREIAPIVKKSKRTLWYLRNKVYDELDQKLDHALINLELALQERGFIPFP